MCLRPLETQRHLRPSYIQRVVQVPHSFDPKLGFDEDAGGRSPDGHAEGDVRQRHPAADQQTVSGSSAAFRTTQDSAGSDSRRSVHDHRAVGHLHHRTFQLHDNGADGWGPAHHAAPHLDDEALVASATLRCQDVVAGGGQLEELPIEGLEVVVPPRSADPPDVGGVGFRTTRREDQTRTFEDSTGGFHDFELLPEFMFVSRGGALVTTATRGKKPELKSGSRQELLLLSLCFSSSFSVLVQLDFLFSHLVRKIFLQLREFIATQKN